MNYLDFALSLIAPHHCYKCHTEGQVCCQKCLDQIADLSASHVCYRCGKKDHRSAIRICAICYPEQSLDSVSWYADYQDPTAAKIIKALKFEHTYSAHRVIATALNKSLAERNKKTGIWFDILSPVPTAGRRARSRGWDQARLIAKDISRLHGVPYKTTLIRASSFDQIGSSRAERSAASKKFFRAHRRAYVEGKTILIVDDVITTGSTLNAAALSLKSAGAKEVHGLVFARQGLKKLN